MTWLYSKHTDTGKPDTLGTKSSTERPIKNDHVHIKVYFYIFFLILFVLKMKTEGHHFTQQYDP